MINKDPDFLPQNSGITQRAAAVSPFNIGIQCEMMELEIMNLVEQDPIGAASSFLGRHFLMKYGYLLEDVEFYAKCTFTSASTAYGAEYPKKFNIGDVLLQGHEITLQLIAEEYLEEAGDLSPFTFQYVTNAEDAENRRREGPVDPFMTDERPDVNVVATNMETGKVEVANLSGKHVDPKDVPNFVKDFREVS